jgi:hypothetical protein
LAELFQTTPQNITIHLKNIFEEGELNEASTCKDFLQVGKEYDKYNLIINNTIESNFDIAIKTLDITHPK